ncbi:hypothetical protein JOF53_000011 [Crossiella equi]|uniref:Insertion element IS402-like domain-containing protein n=1 Tax=Crossiella equi TaxID=130796 RepID=A0ABS5A3I2_9PSEU|nr:transposase [Crossiella equi]MBP2471139.1 hypothetical protein [Crossiella equi]
MPQFPPPLLPDHALGAVVRELPELFAAVPVCTDKLRAVLTFRPGLLEVLAVHPLAPHLSERAGERRTALDVTLSVALTLRAAVLYACGIAPAGAAALDCISVRHSYRRVACYDELMCGKQGIPRLHLRRFGSRRLSKAELEVVLGEFVERVLDSTCSMLGAGRWRDHQDAASSKPVTDAVWREIVPVLGANAGPQHRAAADGVLWKLRTCRPWEELPEEFGDRHAIYRQALKWKHDGTWSVLVQFFEEHAYA